MLRRFMKKRLVVYPVIRTKGVYKNLKVRLHMTFIISFRSARLMKKFACSGVVQHEKRGNNTTR